jgi:hypothetical protein
VNDNGVMVSDVKAAKVFTYDSTSGMTNEMIQLPAGEGEASNLIINFFNDKALVGTTYRVSNGSVGYALAIGDNNSSWYAYGTNNNIPLALSDAYAYHYSAEFFYV